MASNEIDVLSGLNDISTSIFTTVKGETLEDRKRVFNAIQSAERVADHLGKVIKIKDIVVQRVEISSTDEADGSVTTDVAPRVIFLADDGKAYVGLSNGLLRSAENILGVLGDPSTWGEPLAVKFAEKRGRNGFRFMTLDLA